MVKWHAPHSQITTLLLLESIQNLKYNTSKSVFHNTGLLETVCCINQFSQQSYSTVREDGPADDASIVTGDHKHLEVYSGPIPRGG